MQPKHNQSSALQTNALVSFDIPESSGGIYRLSGRLDTSGTARVWGMTKSALGREAGAQVTLDASDLTYCDASGISLLLELRRLQESSGGSLDIRGLADEHQRLFDQFDPNEFQGECSEEPVEKSGIAELGAATAKIGNDLREMVEFMGEMLKTFLFVLRHPRSLRWREVLLVLETAGVNALPIVMLIGFIIGLVMAFQAAMPMRQFGVEIYVADLVSLSLIRELGPLMTGIVIAGRSGSAFAAEIGTMRINEEIDALTTMGINPVRYLVVSRTLAATIATPLLSLFSCLSGILGGALVLISLGYPVVAYFNRVVASTSLIDLSSGLFKATVFGMLVAGVGCLRGLQTGNGSGAVGASTTSAVVSGIVLIAITDGIFSVIFYIIGI